MAKLMQTPSQTVGPFLAIGMTHEGEDVLVNDQTSGQRIIITGTLHDGDGEPITDGVIEIWQADAQGIYSHPDDPRHEKADKHFRGAGRSDTADNGQFSFKTIKPGSVTWDDNQTQAPHINVRVFGRGMLVHAITRLYFSDEEAANASDPVLNLVDDARRQTLIATLENTQDLPTYRLDIRLQGDSETVFFTP